ncbi:MAG: cytochrome bc complex cytochrome b subunit [Chloroflexi bacterium]|nr:cytochrome bc complex cytochrome b subunit [Chloroflexota bacterium]
MATIFEQISEMGLKQALITKTDEVVTRITTGMNISDIRGALRGDEPRRPNPRLRPHADGFWFHIRPSFYHTEVTHIYPTFRLGWLSTFMMVWETITGILLMIFYTPSPLIAYSNMWEILSNVPLGQLMRNMHRLGAEVMVLVVALHMLRTFITGSYKKPRQFTWATGMLLITLTALLSFSGYLLPWDQLAYWALTVFLSGAEAAPAPPVVNQTILFILQGGPALDAGGLLRWYLFHVLLLPLILGVFFFVHYYKVILHGLSLPPGREEVGNDTAKRVPRKERTYFNPDILTSELMWTAILTLFLTAGSLWFWDAPLESHADPVVTPLHVVAPWYLSWSQGWLKLAPKTVVIGFIPFLLVMFIVMPYFEVGQSRRYADRRVGLSISFLFIAFMLVSNWMGTPEFRVASSPEREVSGEVLPEEGPSILKGVPYEYLTVDTYVPLQEIEGNPHLTRALEEYYEAMYRQSCKLNGNQDAPYDWVSCRPITDEDGNIVQYGNHFTDNAMPDPYTELKITQKQDNMVQLQLFYEVVDPQNPGEFLIESEEAIDYRHEEALYEEECQYVNKGC